MKKTLLSITLILTLIVSLFAVGAVPASAAAEIVYLTDLPIVDSVSILPGTLPSVNCNLLAAGAELLISGYPIEKGIVNHNTRDTMESYVDFDISGYNYLDTFAVTVGKLDTTPDRKMSFAIYGDGKELANTGVLPAEEIAYLEVEVIGVQTLRLYTGSGNDGIASDSVVWAYPCLFNSVDKELVSLDVEGISYAAALGKDLDLSEARATITYNTGAFERIDISKVALSGYDKNTAGKQIITAKYETVSTTFEVWVRPESEFDYIDTMEIDDCKIIKNLMPVFGMEFTTAQKFGIAGKRYPHSMALHPMAEADGGDAYVQYQLEGAYTRLHAVVGKSLSTYQYCVQFQIFGDGQVLAESPILAPGQSHVFDVDLTGVKELRVAVNTGGDGHTYDSCGYGDLVLFKAEGSGAEVTTAPVVTDAPTEAPTAAPTSPSDEPTEAPTAEPGENPTEAPTSANETKPADDKKEKGCKSSVACGLVLLAVLSTGYIAKKH